MIITMKTMASTPRRTALTIGTAALTALAMFTPPVSATVPYDEGRITIGSPWTGPARTLNVNVSSGCSYVNDVPTIPILQVSTRDQAWEEYLQATFQVSSTVPFVRTRAEVRWHNRDTGERGTGVEYGINGAILGVQQWEVSPGLTDVEVVVTQSPGVPVEIGPVRSHTAAGNFSVTVNGCSGA